MILIRLKHVGIPSSAAPGTVALRTLEVVWNEDEIGLSVSEETSELLVMLIEVPHVGRCSCVAESASALSFLELIRSQAELRSNAGQYTLTLHALVTDADHKVELSLDAPQ